jgi:hypothetical protein
MARQADAGERQREDQDGNGVAGDRRRERPRTSRLRRALAHDRQGTRMHDPMTKALAGETSRVARDLAAEFRNRRKIEAILSKCGRRALVCGADRIDDGSRDYPTCTARGIVAQPASMNVAAPGGADAIAANSFGTSGLRSASRFVCARSTTTAIERETRFC